MDKELQLLKDFVEGTLDEIELENQLSINEKLSVTLKDESISWANTYVKTNPYDYLMELNIRSISGRMNAQGVLKLFLDRKGIKTGEYKKYLDDYNLIIGSQPDYVDADAGFIERMILPADRSKSTGEIKKQIKAKYQTLFVYHKRPPKWIQQPKWPIKNDKPFYFLGQLEINDCELFHDNGCIYIFIDKENGNVELIKQFY
jgi:hypothetical protein